MKTTFLTSLLAFATTSVFAQSGYYNVTSKPFSLIVKSSNKTLDGTALYACHEGAASKSTPFLLSPHPSLTHNTVEGLCIGPKFDKKQISSSNTFNFNTSTYDENPTNQAGKQGLLTWLLIGGNFQVSSAARLSYDPTSNVALPLFFPGDDDVTQFGFDRNNKLYIRGYNDDTKVPIDVTGKTKDYYRWYICVTRYGYTYTTLAWTLGNGVPQNPTCQKVDVVRRFH
jgi:hypothetical protein